MRIRVDVSCRRIAAFCLTLALAGCSGSSNVPSSVTQPPTGFPGGGWVTEEGTLDDPEHPARASVKQKAAILLQETSTRIRINENTRAPGRASLRAYSSSFI